MDKDIKELCKIAKASSLFYQMWVFNPKKKISKKFAKRVNEFGGEIEDKLKSIGVENIRNDIRFEWREKKS